LTELALADLESVEKQYVKAEKNAKTAKKEDIYVRDTIREIRATAPEAAGEIHTDFQKGFIRAEVIGYDDFVTYNGEHGAKEAGRLRLEGKEYIVQEADVMHFRFNV